MDDDTASLPRDHGVAEVLYQKRFGLGHGNENIKMLDCSTEKFAVSRIRWSMPFVELESANAPLFHNLHELACTSFRHLSQLEMTSRGKMDVNHIAQFPRKGEEKAGFGTVVGDFGASQGRMESVKRVIEFQQGNYGTLFVFGNIIVTAVRSCAA